MIYCNYLRKALERKNILSGEGRPEWCEKVKKYEEKLRKMLVTLRTAAS